MTLPADHPWAGLTGPERIAALRDEIAKLDPKPRPDQLDPSLIVVRNAKTGRVSYEVDE